MRFFLSCLPHPHLITEDSTKQDLSDIQLALFSLKMVCAFLIMTQCSQRKPHLETTEGWRMPFFMIFCLIFYQNLPTSLPWQPAQNMMIYVSIICFHIKTHHIGKFEENLRPCVNSLHYRMLHDYRELILNISIPLPFQDIEFTLIVKFMTYRIIIKYMNSF